MSHSNNRLKSQRAQQAVLLGVGLFITLQAAGLALVEGWKPDLADAEYGVRLENLRRLRNKHPQRPSLIVLGSSRIGNGFETDYATSQSLASNDPQAPIVANMSMTGGTSVWQYLMLRRLISEGVKPDSVIVELMPPSLEGDKQYFLPGYHFPVHRLRYSDLASLDELMPQEAPRHRQEWLYNNAFFPWHNHRFSLIGLYAPNWQVDQTAPNSRPGIWRKVLSPTGWISFGVANPTEQQLLEAEKLAKKSYGQSLANLVVTEEAQRAYRAIFETCRQHQIRITAVVLMPESNTFRSWYSPQGRQAVEQFIASLPTEHHVPVVDAREWIYDDQFWDGHHLLEAGAREFTARMVATVIRPGSTPSDQVLVAKRSAVVRATWEMIDPEEVFSPTSRHRWCCGNRARLRLDNPSSHSVGVALNFGLGTALEQPAQAKIVGLGLTQDLTLTAPLQEIEQIVTVPPGGGHYIDIECDAQPLVHPVRSVRFRVANFTCETLSEEQLAARKEKPLR